MKKTIAIDFDGVIHKYSKGWQEGVIYDDPIEGSLYALIQLYLKGYQIVIFTTRRNTEEVKKWIQQQYNKQFPKSEMIPFEVTYEKPPAIAYIDDRGIRFTDWKDILNYF